MFDICDDYGVWVITTEPKVGMTCRWLTEEDAQAECNRRNFAAGIADENGDLKSLIDVDDEEKFQTVHYAHPECTCFGAMKALRESLVKAGN